MPVSTRSQVFSTEDDSTATTQRARSRTRQEEPQLGQSPLRNPHHRLKEKMKALTLLYEQQKAAAASRKSQSARTEDKCFLTHPSVDLFGSGKGEDKKGQDQKEQKPCSTMRENMLPNSTVTRTFVLPPPSVSNVSEDSKENMVMNGKEEEKKGQNQKEQKPCSTMRENTLPNSTVTRTFVLPPPNVSNISEDSKENMMMNGTDRIVGFTCPTKVMRKLSMGGLGPQSEPKGLGGTKNVQELETTSERSGVCSRILVFVRLRPMAKKEKEAGSRCCVRIVNERDIYLTEFASEMDYLRLKRLRGRHFTFDASFPDSTTQQEVYSTTTAELVEAVLQGRNGSVFCYGATGAGKTYTMLGTVENPGVMVLAIKDLFVKIRQRSCDGNHVVQLSYLEVYNETVRDLLSPGRPLVLREDKQGIMAAGLTQYRAYSTDEVMALLQRGNQNRTTEPTRVNETSSRSHAILQVMVEYRVKDAAMNIVNRMGKLSLIDLAGSERALATDQRTLRSLEGANINRSLLALSSCINALVEGKKHIPYRNSKLTQLLKDSLGGTCNTVMIANISPSNLSFGETQNTLHWADRAKEIRAKACQANEELLEVPESETDQAKLILQLQKENRELRVLMARQQQKLLAAQAQSLAANSSPTPSSVTSLLSPPPSSGQPNEKRRTRSSILAGNCFNTPVSKKRGADEPVRELRRTVKALEAELERMKKEHLLQLKQKDDFIHELSRKCIRAPCGTGVDGNKRVVVTRASLKPKESNEGEIKSPSHRFLSPAPTAKKRSFWDITTANSPSVTKLNSRKTRSHIASGPPPAAPSMLLQPGFARQLPEPPKR